MEIKKEDINKSQKNFFSSLLEYTKKHWYMFIVGLIVLYVLISKSSLKYSLLCITLGILGIILSYKKHSILFESPFNSRYILVFGEKGYQILIYILSLIVIIVGIITLTI